MNLQNNSSETENTTQSDGAIIYCAKCGLENAENNFKCTKCGCALHETPKPQYIVKTDNTMGGLIPYKNAKSLWAYYLGVFSLIPCLGIFIGTAAVIMGFYGLKFYKANPEAGGKAHSITGIVLGGISATGYIMLLILAFLMK